MIKKSIQSFFLLVLATTAVGTFFVYRQLLVVTGERTDKIGFEVKEGQSARSLAERLKAAKVIQSDFFFTMYLKNKGIDKKIQSGIFQLEPPFTIPRVATALSSPENNERTITIIPGWDLRDIAEYFAEERIATKEEFFAFVGKPGIFNNPEIITPYEEEFLIFHNRNLLLSLEGYLAPETYRVYKNEKLESIIKRLLQQREKEFTTEMLQEIEKRKLDIRAILTMASIIEKEVKTPEDKKKVADLFWRRVDAGMGLQADSTVHYLSGREGDVFTKAKERQIDSPYNTYKYRGPPPGPISNPSITSIMAAIYPEKNEAWYFLTTLEGEVIYSKNLVEHNANVAKYLR